MATTLHETFESGTQGAAVNEAVTAFASTFAGAGSTVTYDSAAAVGALSAKIVTANDTVHMRHDIGSAVSTRYVRAYRFLAALPAANVTITEAATAAGVIRAQVQIQPDGRIRIRNGFVTVATTTVVVVPSSLFRLEWGLEGTTQTLRLFTGTNVHGDTPTQTITGAFNTGTFERITFGVLSAATLTLHIDEVKVDDTTWPGSAVTTPPVGDAEQWEHRFNDGPLGAALTPENTGLSTVTGTGTAVFAAGGLGGLAARVVTTSTQTMFLRRDVTGARSEYFFAWYMRTPLPATPNVTQYCAQVVSGSTVRAQVGLGSDATLRLRNVFVAVVSSTVTVQPDELVRLEWHLTDGTQTLRIFAGNQVHTNTPSETITGPYTAGTFDAIVLGNVNAASEWDVTFDNLAGNSETWVGPSSYTPTLTYPRAGWGVPLLVRTPDEEPEPEPPAPTPSGLLVGLTSGARNPNDNGVPPVSTTSVQEFARVEQLIGAKMTIRRTFNGGFPTSFSNHGGNVDIQAGRSASISMKSSIDRMAAGQDDALVTNFVRSIPTNNLSRGLRVYMTWQHEAENPGKNNNPAQLRAGGNRFAQLVKAARVPGQNISIAWTLMGWTFSPASGRDPMDWYWGDDAVEVVAPDPYNMNQTRYVPLSATNVGGGPSHAFARAHGKRYAINEWGCLDHPATDRPRFIREGDTWMRGLTNPTCEFALWFHDMVVAEDGIGHWIDTLNSGQASIDAFAEHATNTVA